MHNGGTYDDILRSISQFPFLQLLKIYKYFSWADKKLHQVFYIENKDDISEDLLSDFKDPDNESKFIKPSVLSNAKGVIDKSKTIPENVIVKEEKLFSEHEYLFGAKEKKGTIDVKSNQDFPDLAFDLATRITTNEA
jgi:hypothetical protein